MIKTWIFEFFHALHDPAKNADPAAVQAHFRWYLDLWTRAETRGFDGIFFSEHHFGAGYSPSPNLIVANLAARTTTMRLGVLGTVTPYATPWRVAEEFAMLDHLTGGRFEAGLVSGIPPELGIAGIPMPLAGARHAATVEVVQAAMAGGPVSHHGPEWNFDDLTFHPSMYQAHPSIWTAVRGRASAETAARRGWKVCSGFNATEMIADMFDGYRKVAAEAGHPCGPEQLAVRRMITFVDDPSKVREGILRGKKSLLDVLNASAGPLPPFAALLDRPDESSDMLSNDEFVSGTPAQVAAELIHQCRTIGASNVMVAFSAIEPPELEEAHRLFAAEVLPHLHAANVS
jgi:alkanesulfonate monooxygenase SsuD/methylene tetrahydromethanopterin reductase-like flavin-dependent oxidoreductase (luciferase family)